MPSGGRPCDPNTRIYYKLQCGYQRDCSIVLTMVALHDIEVKAADAFNTWKVASSREKIWTLSGSEFGNDTGKSVIIVKVLFELKSAGASFQAHLAHCLQVLGHESFKADPDRWWKSKTRPQDKFEYHSCILCSLYPSWPRWCIEQVKLLYIIEARLCQMLWHVPWHKVKAIAVT